VDGAECVVGPALVIVVLVLGAVTKVSAVDVVFVVVRLVAVSASAGVPVPVVVAVVLSWWRPGEVVVHNDCGTVVRSPDLIAVDAPVVIVVSRSSPSSREDTTVDVVESKLPKRHSL
jgi:hypothetical protein